ncbi:hypothetical protein MNBD_NITROSPIRAE02-1486, partial [hydrothermal vent metagenome]
MRKKIITGVFFVGLLLFLLMPGIAGYGVAAMTGETTEAILPVPESNPLTPEKIQFGRRLFMDRNLSDPDAGRTRVACVSCHNPMFGFSDGRVRSTGVYG